MSGDAFSSYCRGGGVTGIQGGIGKEGSEYATDQELLLLLFTLVIKFTTLGNTDQGKREKTGIICIILQASKK